MAIPIPVVPANCAVGEINSPAIPVAENNPGAYGPATDQRP